MQNLPRHNGAQWKVRIPEILSKNLEHLNRRTHGRCREKIERFRSMISKQGAQDRVVNRLKSTAKTFVSDGLTFHDLPIVEGEIHCRVHISEEKKSIVFLGTMPAQMAA